MLTSMRKTAAKKKDPDLRVAPGSAPNVRVTFRLQRLEAHVGFAVGGLALWLALLLQPPGFAPWLLALFAAGVGGWAQAYPARQPVTLFARGLLLVGGGTLFLLTPGLGGPAGLAALWLLSAAVAYALLLPLQWSVPIGAAIWAGYAAACFYGEPAPPWQAALGMAGALGFLPTLCLFMGRTLRASQHVAETAQRDTRSPLYNEAGFFTNGGELFDECRKRGLPFSMVLLQASDLRDVNNLLGRKAANALFAQTVKGIATATPPRGLAARIDSVEFALAMPGLAVDKAEAMLHAALGRPPQVKVDFGGASAVIVLDAVAAQAPPELHTLEELYDRLHQRLRGRAETPNTQPMDRGSTLQGFLMQDPPVPQSQKPTLPMPLARRAPRQHGARRSSPPSRPGPLRS